MNINVIILGFFFPFFGMEGGMNDKLQTEKLNSR